MSRTGCEGEGGWANESVDGNDEESREYWMIIGVWCLVLESLLLV